MSHVNRRSFLEKLGLGVGGFLLGPVANSLVARAQWEMPARKRAVFSLVGAGIAHDLNFVPEDLSNRHKVDNGNHSTADLFCSIATACGVPTDSFGKGGNEIVKGPLNEVMAA